MPTESVVVRASVLDGFGKFLAEQGVELAPLIAKAGLTAGDIADPHAEVPLNPIAELMELAAERARDPCLGLAWSQSFPTGGLRTMAYIALNSRTVREALQSIVRYIGLLTHPMEFEFREEDRHGAILWQWPASLTSPHTQYSTFLVALLITRMRRASRGAAEPLLVEIPHPPLECRERVRQILGPNVDYDASRYAVHYDSRTLDRQFADSDPRLLSIVRPIGEQMLAELQQRGDVTVEARRAILARLEGGELTLDAIAAQMELSSRALQSRLSQAGTTYDALLNETRREMADRYLRDMDLTLTQIACLLGYSELAAFSRAAQRWFGMSPSAYRQKLKEL
jgi:AraC-like DNA-binding protein